MVSMPDSFSANLPPLLKQHMANVSRDGNISSAEMPFFMDSLLSTAGSASPLMQLLLFVYRLLGNQFGIDPSIILTTLGFLWGLSKLYSQIYLFFFGLINRYLMCSINVSEDDSIYRHLMKWMSQHPSMKHNKYLTAQTIWKSAWDDDDDDEEEDAKSLFWTDGGDDEGSGNKYLNFSNMAARSTPRFVPAIGGSSFWHRGNYFKIFRSREAFASSSGWGPMKDVEEIKISCYGWSLEPIKQLLGDAKALYFSDTSQRTTIYRPRAKELRRDYNMWQQVARRPVRPIRTVVLDSKEKHSVLADVNEYLHPSTPRWYASRGIPLRRGYLFHGPPGTGKTSFSFALAGVFGIDIYVISLQDQSVTEEDLAVLFTKLPRRCVILLEDIDTAGLRRDPDSTTDVTLEDKDKENEKEKKDEKGGADDKSSKDKGKRKSKKSKKSSADDHDLSSSSDSSDSSDSESEDDRKSKKRKGGKTSSRKSRSNKKAISLSGLLNAIDGVASHEGRVLIMTTNKPESLDEALVRPGRVDVQVGFGNATCQQAEELFIRMYEVPQLKQVKKISMNGSAKPKPKPTSEATGELANQAKQAYELDISTGDISNIAKSFAQKIPEGVFSPAEIQGFLLKRKKSPKRALDELDTWIDASLKQKEAKSKVVTVQ